MPMKFCHVDRVSEIEKSIYRTPWSRHAFINEILDNEFAFYYVALAEDTVVGYGGIWVILDEAHVTNLAVSPAWQGRGIGKALLQHLIREAALLGAKKMTLEVRVSNLKAQALYRKFGFVDRGIRPNYYADEDALVMWLEKLPAELYG